MNFFIFEIKFQTFENKKQKKIKKSYKQKLTNFKNMDINEKIIELVKKYDCIYNLQSPQYKNFQFKSELWKKIGENVKGNANVSFNSIFSH